MGRLGGLMRMSKWDANAIRSFRHSYGLRQSDLSGLLGATQQMISLWENDKVKIGRLYAKELDSISQQLAARKPIGTGNPEEEKQLS